MPNVPLERDMLFHALGKTFTDKEFDELCFEFGIELDEVVTETRMKRKQGENEDIKATLKFISQHIEIMNKIEQN